MSKHEQLLQVKEDILTQQICPELASQATQLVFASGNPNSNLVLIGEAPGKEEDLQGLPFVGASGKLLDQLLLILNRPRESVYITNIVKYRPPKNRDPKPEEKFAFLPFLERQLAIIQPKIIVPLGRHALNTLIPSVQISQVHGTLQVSPHGWKVFPSYHPAAALYNGSLRATLQEDFQRLKNYLES